MWLKVVPTNHDPKVIARYYLECVESCRGEISSSIVVTFIVTMIA